LDKKNKILNIYFATSKTCNINCKNCYLSITFKQSKKITDTKILTSIDYFIEKIESEGFRIGKFCLHGAEPSLMSAKTMGKIINRINEHWKGNKTENIAVSIQTNGIRLTKSYLEEVIQIIENPKKFKIGFSIDPPKIIHDSMREDSYNIVMKNYKIAQILGFPTGILSVITTETMTYLSEFGQWIKNELRKKEKYGNPYMIKVKLATGNYALNETQLISLSKFLIKNNLIPIMQVFSASYCIQNGNDCEWYEFDIDGNCYSCNKNYNSNGIFANWQYESFDSIIIKRKKLFENEFMHPDCSKCCYEMVCNSGCPLDRHKQGKMKGKAYECVLIKYIYKHLEEQGVSISEFFYNNK
jgi:radical SAM protein with 4Fe4S-binding SPASM domain